jgi:threonine dehydrogenase-like Zn-dependent dehydrogenase
LTGANQFNNSWESTSFEGQTVIVSVWEKDATITPNNLVLKEKEVIGINFSAWIWPELINLITAGKMWRYPKIPITSFSFNSK